ncbi:hypothetical protein COUCH_11200 [Couchioplanes caeruleus]|uniref:hypothetical protein n=1 Tax=Couchioplanes caeruleus TaxID=56438 RepID=UPI0020BF86DB|nr:hypothetical protein [Couchioplanes caeruleus]UQU66790.1 hypothetical protein COUCH_11200 [Couchioplanes caeruleus]
MNWIPALVTGGLAFSAAILVAVLNNKSLRALAESKKLADQKLSQQQAEERSRLVRLESLQSEESAALKAKREYEYEALKRLYTVARPLMFQLGEACEVSNRRIDKILLGVIKLHAGSSSLVTTAYRLGAPLVLVVALRRELTTTDLSLDPRLREQYVVARELLFVFQNGYELAACSLRVPDYRKNKHEPRQHLTVRQLDGLLEGLSADHLTNGAVKSFSEFERDPLTCRSKMRGPRTPRLIYLAGQVRT